MTSDQVVVIGAGQAGVSAAFATRTAGHVGPVLLVGDEPGAPYSRPPLSKSHLAGVAGAQPVPLRPAAAFADAGIELIHGTAALAINRATRTVTLDDGRVLPYARLLLATGARPRMLPCLAGVPGVVTVRTLADADGLRTRLAAAPRVVVIGGGVLGLEVAGSARARGASVTVLEAASRLMQRAVSTPVAEHLRRLHEAHGVEVRLGATVEGVELDDKGRLQAIVTSDGSVAADLVVVATGVLPETRLAADAGLPVDDGILVDAALLTADPFIAAAGDCVRLRTADDGAGVRRESEASAIEQGNHAGRWLAGGPAVPFTGVDWCWTEQHGRRVFFVGSAGPGDEQVVRGDPAGPGFAVYHLRDGSVTAVEAVDSVADHRVGRRLLGRPDTNRDLLAADVADPERPVVARPLTTASSTAAKE